MSFIDGDPLTDGILRVEDGPHPLPGSPVMTMITRDELDKLQRAFNALELIRQLADLAFDNGRFERAEDRPMIALAAKILQEADAVLA